MTLKQELVQYYKWLRQYALNDSHSGNVSVKDTDCIWITPTGACADTLTEHDLIACDINQPAPDEASFDAPLHLASYRDNPQLKAIFHSHGAHTVAMTMDGQDFVPFDFEGQLYFGKVPVICLNYDDIFAESAVQISEKLKTHKAAVMCGHGVYVAAESLNLAYKWTCSLELSAKTAFIAKQAGTFPKPC